MVGEPERHTVRVHQEPGHALWAEVLELPGCFASGDDTADLRQALVEAMGLYLSGPDSAVRVRLEDEPGTVIEQHVLARTA